MKVFGSSYNSHYTDKKDENFAATIDNFTAALANILKNYRKEVTLNKKFSVASNFGKSYRHGVIFPKITCNCDFVFKIFSAAVGNVVIQAK